MTQQYSDDSYPGSLLGLPQSGPGSLAPWPRRLLALAIDWAIASVISATWFDFDPIATLVIFAITYALFVALLGVTMGKRLVRIQVVRLRPSQSPTVPGPIWAAVRLALLLLILPPVLISADGRGLHERISDTVQVRM